MGQTPTTLEHPIDIMDLIHSALRNEGAKLEESIRRLDFDQSLQLIRLDFIRWAAALMFHAEQEDQYMTPLLVGSNAAKDSEAEHAELTYRLEEVNRVFDEEIGRTKLIARTHRHLYGAIVALRISQDDHLESEEAFVLPEIRECLGKVEQTQIVQRLLIDEQAADQGWVVDWLGHSLESPEREILANLQGILLPK